MVEATLEFLKSVQNMDVGLGGSRFRNFAKKESMKKAFQDMLHGLGEVNPTHAYYNGFRTSKDNEDPSRKLSKRAKDFDTLEFPVVKNSSYKGLNRKSNSYCNRASMSAEGETFRTNIELEGSLLWHEF
uniref:Uncharacterized protein n=1 Tax=Tanacetum cinerariifolium TaxID=118510 RepID=A0A6L2MHC2_TANCI|nr:hypothetical protein [Tanacetum cinerariifolium]